MCIRDSLYPAGAPAAQIHFKPSLQLPPGWKFGTVLPVESQSASEIIFQTAALDRLLDSPVVAGEYYRVIDLTPPGEPIHHEIDIVADSKAALAMSPEVQQGLTNLVAESGKLFGTRHYREYHFLLTLSDHTPHFGVEHHESNDSRLPERVFLSPTAAVDVGGLLAHEFAHSWSGKFRRPKDISPSDFQTPLQTALLWVYEGNTSYLGDVLAARELPRGGRISRGISITTFSIGLNLTGDGVVTDAIFGGPAFKAGIAPGMKIAAVDGRVFTPEILDDAIKSSKSNARPIELLVIANDYYKTSSIDYHDGVRYPHLIRIAGKRDTLESLLKPEAR